MIMRSLGKERVDLCLISTMDRKLHTQNNKQQKNIKKKDYYSY